jgi:nucleoside-triphosphatase THEP1
MKLKDKINKEVYNRTGFDVPELCGNVKLTKKEILDILRHQKGWFEDYANDCNNQIDKIIVENFTIDERLS